MILSTYCIVDTLIIISTVLYILYWYHTKNFNYWKVRGVPYVRPHWFFGNIGEQIFQRKTCVHFANNLYNKFKDNGFGGLFIFRKPAIFICDSSLIEKILTQDFAYFQDRNISCNPDEPLSDTLVNASGDKWRKMRQKLVPTFSLISVKGMFDQIYKCGDYLLQEIDKLSEKNEAIEIEPLAFVYSTEVISSCIFGVQLMSDSNEGRRFRNAVNLIFETSPIRLTKKYLGIMYPRLFCSLGIRYIPKIVTDFFMTLTRETIKYREQNNIYRNDFLQMMLNLKKQEETDSDNPVGYDKGNAKNKFHNSFLSTKPHTLDKCFSEKSIPSLVFNFMSAGIKPSVSAITFTLFELAKNPLIQKRLQEEVHACIAKQGELDYQAIKNMTYLDQILQEIHRLYTFQKVLTRQVTKSYDIPGTDVRLEKGTVVYIPATAIHMDPKYYPSPEEFNPDRFADNNFKPSVAYMPYGHGPRICIGIRFAVLLMKVCVARLMSKYTVQLEMPLPIRWDDKIFSPEPKDGIWLSFHKRN